MRERISQVETLLKRADSDYDRERLRRRLARLLAQRADLDEIASDRAACGFLLEGSLLQCALVDEMRFEEFLSNVFDHERVPEM